MRAIDFMAPVVIGDVTVIMVLKSKCWIAC